MGKSKQRRRTEERKRQQAQAFAWLQMMAEREGAKPPPNYEYLTELSKQRLAEAYKKSGGDTKQLSHQQGYQPGVAQQEK